MFRITGLKLISIESKLQKNNIKNEVLKSDSITDEVRAQAEKRGNKILRSSPTLDFIKTQDYEGRTRHIVTAEAKVDVEERRKNKRTPSTKANNSHKTRRRGT